MMQATMATVSLSLSLFAYSLRLLLADSLHTVWSEVFAEDMFSQFEEHGALNQEVGERYRTNILQPGASKPAMEMLQGFLHRKPSEEAFLKSLGLK
jgi:Zn-dependent oligopeptidase